MSESINETNSKSIELTSASSKYSQRQYISLPINKEISYSSLLEALYETEEPSSSQAIPSEISQTYCYRIRDLINRAESFGISAKHYKYHRDSSEDETESQSASVLSSFIDNCSEDTDWNTQDFNQARDEGFCVVFPDEIQVNNSLKRTRDEDLLPNSIDLKIKEIKDIYSLDKVYVKIPKRVSIMIKEVALLIDQDDTIDSELVLRRIGQSTGLGIKKIKSHIEQLNEREYKAEMLRKYKVKLREFKKLVGCYCSNERQWSEKLEKMYQDLIRKLEKYVEASNEFNSKYETKGEALRLSQEKERINSEIIILGGKRSGNYSQPIEIESQNSPTSISEKQPSKNRFDNLVERNLIIKL